MDFFRWKVSTRESLTTFELIGGLGNQLFCYYAALGFREKNNVRIALDVKFREHFGHNRELSILRFELDKNIVFTTKRPPLLIAIYRLARHHGHFASLIHKILGIKIITETGFDESVITSTDVRRFHGYFQSAKYFTNVNSTKMTLKTTSDWFSNMSARAQQIRPIMVHVRRGDYEKLSATVGVLNAEYFRSALDLVCETTDTPIWIFSDDLTAVKREFDFLSRYPVEWVFEDPHSNPAEILILLTLGSGLVCSNSTFSWWAAYWSAPDAQIIVPNKWFKNLPDPNQLYFDNWKQVKSRWN